ncbi:type I polyketide synthase [Nocardia ninae]|uniref:Uncharacterized protein n=1 Tax=Nocardia ninae NBRC 108245 TaxID=1210091 RepID=A0A511MI70_9NOCA|nr:type I polyketide synthase [Nocardia ninae]GEM40151.1 hypothetical protein NN4_46700 [Nocardia ninae NBRC 108245]
MTTITSDLDTDSLIGALRKALVERESWKRRAEKLELQASDPVVIVGMGCRFPGGVSSPAGLWDVVVGERDVISGFPVDRGWDVEGVFDPVPGTPGRSYVREGGFLDGAAEFDAGFFGISPREALAMDPQQRLLLEVSWEAVESAGIDPRRLKGSNTGVYTGLTYQGYGAHLINDPSNAVDGLIATGNTSSVASGRVSYVLGLEGPSLSVDTACSSSLVALHLAAHSLRRGECDLALVAGATIMATSSAFVEFSQLQALAADGRCKAFAEGADGFVPSEGVGVLVVERLSDAVRLGHRVLAVARGSAVNQDGASNGLSAPNGPAQQRVIRAALADSRLSGAQVDVVEAQGTGTPLGDPIEAHALMATYGRERPEDRPLWLGSVKSNIGHTQAAAGMAGIIKMVEAMRRGVLPKTLHAEIPSAEIDWSSGTVRLLTEEQPWPRTDEPRRAGVSAFGISGTNAHVILEESPTNVPESLAPQPVPARPAVMAWVLSGRSADVVAHQAHRLWTRVNSDPEIDPADVGMSLANRTQFEHRAVVIGTDRTDLLAALQTVGDDAPDDRVVRGHAGTVGKTIFVFSGRGPQYAQPAVELLDTSSAFAEYLLECEHVLAEFVDWRLTDVLRGAPGAPGLDHAGIEAVAHFAVTVALARLWQSIGVGPDAVLGHAAGEIAAANIAGTLTLREATHIVAYRNGLAEAVPQINSAPATIREYSSGTGGALGAGASDGRHWIHNPNDAKKFEQAVLAARTDGGRYFLEISLDPCLVPKLADIFDTRPELPTTYICGNPRHGADGLQHILTAAAELYCAGGKVDWSRFFVGTHAGHVDLPTYAFDRKPYWLEPTRPAVPGASAAGPAESAVNPDDEVLAALEKRSSEDRYEALLEVLCREINETLRSSGHETITADISFTDIGLDSISAAELRNGLTAVTGLRLPTSIALRYPTPAALTAHILELLEETAA